MLIIIIWAAGALLMTLIGCIYAGYTDAKYPLDAVAGFVWLGMLASPIAGRATLCVVLRHLRTNAIVPNERTLLMLILFVFFLLPWLLLGLFAVFTSAVPLLMVFAFLAHGAITVGAVHGLLADLEESR